MTVRPYSSSSHSCAKAFNKLLMDAEDGADSERKKV